MIVVLTDGIILESRIDAGEIVEHVTERVMGRVTAAPIIGYDGREVLPKNHLD